MIEDYLLDAMETLAMRLIKRTISKLREWFDKNFTFRGLIAFCWFVLTTIPRWFGIKNFWSTHLALIWRVLIEHGTIAVAIACAVLIWLDHRRVLKKREPQPYDPNSVKGRTLQLRDDLQKLADEAAVKWPEIVQGTKISPYDDS